MRGLIAPLAILVAVASACAPHPLDAADITVHVLNGKTGKPMANVPVLLDGSKGLRGPAAGSVNDYLGRWQATTDSEGKAVFHLADPVPPKLAVGAAEKGCSDIVLGPFDSEEILNKGLIGPDEFCDRKGKLKGKFSPKPGEVILFRDGRYTWWDHFLQEAF